MVLATTTRADPSAATPAAPRPTTPAGTPAGAVAATALATWVEAARGGDRAALDKVLAAEEQRIYAFGMRMCRNPDDAQDLLQDTMLAIAQGIRTFRGEASLSTWIFQIARSVCIKKRRRKKGQPAVTEALDVEGAILADTAPGPDKLLDQRQSEALLRGALAQLPVPAREIIVLRDVEGLSAPEVAAVLGISVDAVKSRLHRARAALEKILAPALQPSPSMAASGRDCPDILARYSQKLEDDLTGEMCAQLEQHLAGCSRCQGACHALKQSLALCQHLPTVPPEVSQSVRRALQKLGG